MDFEPRRWQPPADLGLVGPFAVNEDLRPAALWDTTGVGPEDVAIDAAGRAVTGLRDGRIVRFDIAGGRPETIADVGGRPLGIEPAANGDGFIIANADLGLQRLTADGRIEILTDRHRDREFMLTNNAAVADDGTIFFSVSSHRWPLSEYNTDILERSATGSLYRLETSGELDLLVDGLVFANGVALSADASFVLVAELGSYRIHRVWLDGDRAGKTEIFCDNLPGFPDNLNLGNGLFWCAFPRTRDRLFDATLTRPRLRSILHRLPPRVSPRLPTRVSRHGFVVAFDDRGAVHANLQDPTGRVAVTTTAIANGRYLYVGSLSEPTLAVLTLPDRLVR